MGRQTHKHRSKDADDNGDGNSPHRACRCSFAAVVVCLGALSRIEGGGAASSSSQALTKEESTMLLQKAIRAKAEAMARDPNHKEAISVSYKTGSVTITESAGPPKNLNSNPQQITTMPQPTKQQ
jgi:hypothetical protein